MISHDWVGSPILWFFRFWFLVFTIDRGLFATDEIENVLDGVAAGSRRWSCGWLGGSRLGLD